MSHVHHHDRQHHDEDDGHLLNGLVQMADAIKPMRMTSSSSSPSRPLPAVRSGRTFSARFSGEYPAIPPPLGVSRHRSAWRSAATSISAVSTASRVNTSRKGGLAIESSSQYMSEPSQLSRQSTTIYYQGDDRGQGPHYHRNHHPPHHHHHDYLNHCVPWKIGSELAYTFFIFGIVGVGGYTAQLALMHNLFVLSSKPWITADEFRDYVGISVLFPGSISSKMTAIIGTFRTRSEWGGLISVLAFAFPGFCIMTCAGLGLIFDHPREERNWMNGLGPASSTLVFIMAMTLARKVIIDTFDIYIMAISVSLTTILQCSPHVPVHTLTWFIPVELLLAGCVALGVELYLDWTKKEEVFRRRSKKREQQQQQHQLPAKGEEEEEKEETMNGGERQNGDMISLELAGGGEGQGPSMSLSNGEGGDGQSSQIPPASPKEKCDRGPQLLPPMTEEEKTRGGGRGGGGGGAVVGEEEDNFPAAIDFNSQPISYASSGWSSIPPPPPLPNMTREESEAHRDIAHAFYVSRLTSGLIIGIIVFLFITFHILRALNIQPQSQELRLYIAYFLQGLGIWGGPSEVLSHLAIKLDDKELTSVEDVRDGFALILMLPGPPYNIAAYLGAKVLGLKGAIIAWIAFTLTSSILLIGTLPGWSYLRSKYPLASAFLSGVSAAAIGIMLAIPDLTEIKTAADLVVSVSVLIVVVWHGFPGAVGVVVGGLIGYLLSPSCLNIGQSPYTYAIHREN